MNLRCKINNKEYDVCQGVPFSDEYDETLDSGTIIIDQVHKLKNLRPYDDVIIWDADYECLGYNENGEPLFEGYTFDSWDVLSGYPKYKEGKTIFYKHLLVDSFSEDIINLCGRQDGKSIYKYKIQMFSETKGLEVVQLPNLSITESLNVNKKISVWEYMKKYVDLYSPKYKRKKKKSDGTYSRVEWEFVPKYKLSPSLKDIFENLYSPDFDLTGANLKDILSRLMIVKDMIPYVKNGVIYAIDITKRNGEFDNNPEHVNFITGNYTSSNYCDSLRTTYSNAISDENSARYTEFLGFRNYDNSLMTIENMRLETQFPIYKINKIYMYYFKKYSVYDENLQIVEKDNIFLCKQDITPLVKLDTERNLLSQDWSEFNSFSGFSSIYDLAKYKMMTVGYNIGSKYISGWGTKYQYPQKKALSVWDIEKTYIQNIVNAVDMLNPFGISENKKLLEKYQNQNLKITFTNSIWDDIDATTKMISPFTNSSLKLKSFFFEIDYQGFYNGAVVHSKDIGRDDIVINNNPNSGLTLLEKDGLYQKEQLNRFGNKVVTVRARYDDISQLQPLGSVLNLEDENDIIIFHREYSIYDKMILATYMGSKDYVLKNYHTSVYAKHRTWSLMNYNEAVTRAENKKMFLSLSKESLKYEKDKDFLGEINDLSEKCISFLPSQEEDLSTIGVIKYGHNYYAVDLNKFVSGYSLCFNMSMKDNISSGMYISIPAPDMNDDWDLANKIEEDVGISDINVKQLINYMKMEGIEGDYSGSLQDWYSLIDDSETGFSEKLGFYVYNLDRKKEYDKIFTSDETDYVKNKIYNDLFALPLLPYTFNVDNISLSKSDYNIYLNNSALSHNSKIIDYIKNDKVIKFVYSKRNLNNLVDGKTFDWCGFNSEKTQKFYANESSMKEFFVSLFESNESLKISATIGIYYKINAVKINSNWTFDYDEMVGAIEQETFDDEIFDSEKVSQKIALLNLLENQSVLETLKENLNTSQKTIFNEAENKTSSFMTYAETQIKNLVTATSAEVKSYYVPVLKMNINLQAHHYNSMTEDGINYPNQLQLGWNIKLVNPIETSDGVKYYEKINLEDLGIILKIEDEDNIYDKADFVISYKTPINKDIGYIGNEYDIWKDNKEKIDMTYQIEPITSDKNVSFSPWLMKLSNLNDTYKRYDEDIIQTGSYEDTNNQMSLIFSTYKPNFNKNTTCPLVFLRVQKKYLSLMYEETTNSDGETVPGFNINADFTMGVRGNRASWPFDWLREVYAFQGHLGTVKKKTENSITINCKETFWVVDVGANRKHKRNTKRTFTKQYEDEEYIVYACLYSNVKKMRKKKASPDNTLYYSDEDYDGLVGEYKYDFTATNGKEVSSTNYEDVISKAIDLLNRNFTESVFFSKTNPSIYKNMFIVTSKDDLNIDLVYEQIAFANEFLNYTFYPKGSVVTYRGKLYQSNRDTYEKQFVSSYWDDISSTTYLKDGHIYKLGCGEDYWNKRNFTLTNKSVTESLFSNKYFPSEKIKYKTATVDSTKNIQYVNFEKLASSFEPGKYSLSLDWRNGQNETVFDEVTGKEVNGYWVVNGTNKISVNVLVIKWGLCPNFVDYIKDEDGYYYASFKNITIDFEVFEYEKTYYPLGNGTKKENNITIYLNNRAGDDIELYEVDDTNTRNANILKQFICSEAKEEKIFNLSLERIGNSWYDNDGKEYSYHTLLNKYRIKPETNFVYTIPATKHEANLFVVDTANISDFKNVYIDYSVTRNDRPYLLFQDEVYNTDEPIKSIQYWYVNKDTLNFVFGVNISDEDKEKGYIKIYTSLLSSRDDRVYDENHNLIGNVWNYVDDDYLEYGIGQFFKSDDQEISGHILKINRDVGIKTRIFVNEIENKDMISDFIFLNENDQVKIEVESVNPYNIDYININGNVYGDERYTKTREINFAIKNRTTVDIVSERILSFNINKKEDVNLTVTRLSSLNKTAKIGIINSKDEIYLGDVIQVDYASNQDFEINRVEYNDVSIESGKQFIIEGNVNIVAIAKRIKQWEVLWVGETELSTEETFITFHDIREFTSDRFRITIVTSCLDGDSQEYTEEIEMGINDATLPMIKGYYQNNVGDFALEDITTLWLRNSGLSVTTDSYYLSLATIPEGLETGLPYSVKVTKMEAYY